MKESNIYFNVSTKGGVGKTFISKNVFPALLTESYKKINVYEIDNSNTKGDFKSEIISYKNFKIDEQNEAIFDVAFNEDDKDTCSIIDVAGDITQVKAVISALAKNYIENINFYIPVESANAQVDNVKETIAEIRTKYPKSKITLILNKVTDMENPQEQFINIYGSEKYGYKSRWSELEKEINSIALIPAEAKLLFITGEIHRVSLADLYVQGKEFLANIKKYRQTWKKESIEKNDREYFDKKMSVLSLASEVVDFIDICKKTLKV